LAVNLVWSITLAAVGVIGIWLAGNRSRLGWALGLSAQALWVVFAVVTGQYGFILSALAYGFVYGRNLWRWSRPRCEHRALRCVHGDEINALDGARVACAECGRPFPSTPLLLICTSTGRPHSLFEFGP
jgi:hypothetical protein